MKRLIVIILALMYLGLSTGAPVHLHYCMGKLVSKNLADPLNKKCNKCGSENPNKPKKKDCCKDEYKLVKIVKDQKTAEAFHNITSLTAAIVPSHYPILSTRIIASETETHPVSNAPPNYRRVPIYIRNCVYRI